jgi:hypothetical protein
MDERSGKERGLFFVEGELAPDGLGRKGVQARAGEYDVRIKLSEKIRKNLCKSSSILIQILDPEAGLAVCPATRAEQGPGQAIAPFSQKHTPDGFTPGHRSLVSSF